MSRGAILPPINLGGPPLARARYREVEVGQAIRPDFYNAIAEILAFVYQLNGRMAG